MRSIVDFPAPFGPRSAVTPGPISKLTSETATSGPNHFDTFSCDEARLGHFVASMRR